MTFNGAAAECLVYITLPGATEPVTAGGHENACSGRFLAKLHNIRQYSRSGTFC
jgi:hypothetical protein